MASQEVARIDFDYARLDVDLRGPNPGVPADAYLAGLAPGSRRTMRQALRWIAEDYSMGRANERSFPWAFLRYEQTQEIRTRLAGRYAAKTANKMLSALRGVLKECWRLQQIGVEELHRACDLKPVTGPSKPAGRYLTQAQVDVLLMHGDNMRDRYLVRFMVTTGLRRAEVAAVRWQDFRIDGAGQSVRVYGKGAKVRYVPVPQDTWARLPRENGWRPEDLVFKVSPARIWQILRAMSFDADMPPVSPHDLRRTYATRLLDAGVDLPTVQRLMGHADPKTTSNYDRRGDAEAFAAVAKVFE